jgi:PAS domain S-box-containing protein
MIRNLNTKIITLFTMILFISTIAATWFGGSMFIAQYSSALKSKVLVVGQDLKLQLERLLALEIPMEDLMGFEEQCQQVVSKYPDISFAGIVAPNGRILFRSGSDLSPEYLQVPILRQALNKDIEQVKTFRDRGKTYYGFVIPLLDIGGRHLGAVVLSLPEKVITSKVFFVTVYSVIISFLIFLLSLLLIFYFLRLWITIPLEKLNQATRAIGTSGIESFQKIRITSDDEMGDLANSFNSMANELQKTMVSKEYLDNIITGMTDALIVMDSTARIQSINQAAMDMLQYSRDGLFGRSMGILFPTDILLREDSFLSQIGDSGFKNHETLLISKTGDQIPVLLSTSIIRDEQAGIRYIVCTAKDISVRKQTEEILLRQTEKLTRSNAELQEFAYVVSHDLQEPLRKIIAFGDHLKSKCSGLDEQSADYLTRIINASIRMQTLINDLLAYSRVTTRAQSVTRVNLSQIAADVLGDLEMRIEQTGGRVLIENLPEIEADPTQMRQLFQNIIGNALKFHQPNQPPLIKISARVIPAGPKTMSLKYKQEYCEICFEDNGIGIEAKYFSRIFGVFQRLHSRDEYEGTGVGLAICQKIVEKHSGNIRVQSEPGMGTKFFITLPVKHKIPAEF